MIRLMLIVSLVLICGCVVNDSLPTPQIKYETVNVSGVEVVPATQTSQLYVGMSVNDVYKILGRPSGQMGAFVLLFDLYEPRFSGRTVPYYVLLNQNENVKHWGSSGSPDKAIDVGSLGY